MPDSHASPLLVLIHALGADATMWDAYSKLVDPRIRVRAPDLFGVGATPRHASPPRVEDHADHLGALLRDRGDRIILAGCAIGSMVAAETAARLGDRVYGLVMANPIPRITAPAGAVLKARALRARSGGIEAIADEVIGRGFEGLDDESSRSAFRQRLLSMSGASYADLAEGICGADITTALASLACPVLLVPGERDMVLPATLATETAALCRNARITPAPSGGHFLPCQAPDEFAAITRPFLRMLMAEARA